MHFISPVLRLGATILVSVAITLAAAPASSRSDSADDLVRQADIIRFPPKGFQVDVRVTNHFPDRKPQKKGYRVLANGPEKSLVMSVAPKSERGQILLMKGSDLWAFMPKVSQPIRLPLSQRLTGQVANGDLARAQFSQDYSATLVRQERLKDEESLLLELVAHKGAKTATYKRILYWLNKEDKRPLQAEFYSASGKLLKTARYENYTMMEGKLRPSRLVMTDNYIAGRYSVLTYANMRARNVPDKFFSKNYLKKLR